MRLPVTVVIALAAILLAASGPSLAGDRALVVGVGQYPGLLGADGRPGGHNLAGPPLDAQHVTSMLVDTLGYAPDEVQALTDEQASRAAIIHAFKSWLIDGTQAGDRVFFYFSGHGAEVTIGSGRHRHLTTGLVPADARTTVRPNATTVGGLLLGSQLGRLVRQLKGRKVTIVADACHSGSLTRDPNAHRIANPTIRTITPSGPLDLDPKDVTARLVRENKLNVRLLDFNVRGGISMPNIAVWSAATIAQYSWDSPTGGIFTNAFVQGLRDRNVGRLDSSQVTASELLGYVRDVAAKFCAATKGCTAFTPELEAPDTYRAAVLAPYPSTTPPITDNGANPPDGAQLVDLAQGVLTHTNDFALNAAILPSAHVRLGSIVRFRINSAETGALLVLDTGPDGKLRQIFPNPYAVAAGKTGDIRSDAPLTIPDESYPFRFTATDPGNGTLIVLVAEPGMDFRAILSGTTAFQAIDQPARNLVALAGALQQPVLNPDPGVPNRARRWAFVTVSYHVAK